MRVDASHIVGLYCLRTVILPAEIVILVIIIFSRVLRDSITRYVGRSVGPSVGHR